MRIIKLPEESDRDVINDAYEQALNKFDIPPTERKEACTWNFIQQDVGKTMQPKVLGKILPLPKLNRGRVNVEVARASHISFMPFLQAYPFKVKSDAQRFQYLTKMFVKEEINKDVYVEFADVLDVKNKDDTIKTIILEFEARE